MVKYKKIYLDYFGYGEQDFIPCESCGGSSVDVHHLTFRSHGGKDEINNLAGVCRECHNKSHNSKEFNEILRQKHLEII